jgi:cell wall-associated NlpC family hydrolase
MKRAILIATGTVGGLGAVLAVTPPQFTSTQNASMALPGAGVNSAAPSATSSAGQSATATPTTSATPSKSRTPSITSSKSATPSKSRTPTKSVTPSQTITPTNTITNTATPTNTPTATVTPSQRSSILADVLCNCSGNTNRNIYVFYDGSGSYSDSLLQDVSLSVRMWYSGLTTNSGWTGNLYEMVMWDERWVSWPVYPIIGTLSGATIGPNYINNDSLLYR